MLTHSLTQMIQLTCLTWWFTFRHVWQIQVGIKTKRNISWFMQVVTLTHRLSHSPHSLAHSLIHPLTHSHYCSVQLHELTVIVMALFFFCFLILHSLGDLICALLLYTTDTIPVDTRYGGSWAWVCEWASGERVSERGMSFSGWVSGWMSERVNEWAGEWVSGWVNEWMNEWMNEWVIELVNEWVSELAGEWVNE